mmetsp:Transcript_45181/g.81271  ORF Transcript_45181/g.81271 Transcript_45181/m.81271 type:complete len:187 (+) Transcript_45181:69-629(+)
MGSGATKAKNSTERESGATKAKEPESTVTRDNLSSAPTSEESLSPEPSPSSRLAGSGRRSRTEELREACRMAREQLSQTTKKTEPSRITMTIPRDVDTWDFGLRDGLAVGSEDSQFSELSDVKYPRQGLRSSLETAKITYFTKNIISTGFHDLRADVQAKRDQLPADEPPQTVLGQGECLRRSTSF